MNFTPDTVNSRVIEANKKPMSFSRILKQSVRGDLDFKIQLNKSKLYLHNGILYNRNEAGNFTWAYYLESHGYGYFTQGGLAQGGSIIQGRFDESWDVKARHAGRDYYLLH